MWIYMIENVLEMRNHLLFEFRFEFFPGFRFFQVSFFLSSFSLTDSYILTNESN